LTINKNKVIAAAQKYQQKGQLDKAIKELQLLVDDDPKDVRTLLKIGDLQSKKGDRPGATATYMRVAEFYSQQGFFLKAVAVYKQILRVDQGIAEVNLKLAELYNQLGLVSDAMTQYQQVVANYERQGQTTESLMVLRKMVELDPDNIASRIKLAELCSAQGLVADAVKEFDSAATYLKQQQRQDDWIKVAERLVFHDAMRLDVLKELAGLYLQRNDTKRALAKLQICFKSAPRDLVVLDLLARAFSALGQAPKALSVYKEIAKIHDDEGRPDQAAQVWETIGGLAPDDAEYRARMGLGQPGPIEPSSPPSFPSFPPTSGGSLQPVPASTVTAAPARAEPARPVARPAPVPPAEPAPSPAGAAEQTAKLLSETDVYIKYGLKDRALEHLRKIFELDPDFEAAYVKQKSIALAMGDRALAARAIENLVRIAVNRDDVDTAAGHVAEIEGFLPGYAGLPGLRAALRGGPVPSGPMSGADDFDDVSVDIAVAADEDIEELEPESVEELQEELPRQRAVDVLDLSAADELMEESHSALRAAEAGGLYQMEDLEAAAAQLGDDEELLLGAGDEEPGLEAADLLDQAVQSVVQDEPAPGDRRGQRPRIPAALDEPEIPDDLVLGSGEPGDDAQLLHELEDDVEAFEEVLPTTMMSAREMAAMRAGTAAQVEPPRPAPPPLAPEPELLDDAIAGVADDLILAPADDAFGDDNALAQSAGYVLDDHEAFEEPAATELGDASQLPDLDRAVLAASGLMTGDDGAVAEPVDGGGDLLGVEHGQLPAGQGEFGDDDGLLGADAGSLDVAGDEAGDAWASSGSRPQAPAAVSAEIPDDAAMALHEDALPTRASDDEDEASAFDEPVAPTAEFESPLRQPSVRMPPPVFEPLDEPAPAADEPVAPVADTGAADAIFGGEEPLQGAAPLPASSADEAFVPTAQFQAPRGPFAELELADDEDGAFKPARPSAEARLQQAIAAASTPQARDSAGDEAGIGTSTEIMGLSDNELAEIRAFAAGKPQRLPSVPPPRPRAPLSTPASQPVPAAPPPAPRPPPPLEPAPGAFDEAAVTDPSMRSSSPAGSEPDPAEEFFGDELGEADFFVRQGLLDEARDILQSILEDVPDSKKAAALLATIEAQESGGNGEAEAAPREGAFDLASELESELEDLGVPDAPAEDFQYSVDEVFSEFKRGVEKAVSADDADTHYDLGIAYKEMGLVEDAIHEFEISSASAAKRADALYMMGICEVELGRHANAVKRFKDAIHVDNINPAQKLAVMFELGVAHQALDQTAEALAILDKVYKKNPKFKDVAERVQALGGGDPVAGSASRPPVKKGKNISYL
jgi:tetratricopeptide (TPR) repeat protein